MADAAANLPGYERILIREGVDDDEDGFGMIELVHGEQGIGGAITKRGDKSCVVRGAVVVDVVGPKCGAREALEQVILFIGSAIRTDEADGFLVAGVVS